MLTRRPRAGLARAALARDDAFEPRLELEAEQAAVEAHLGKIAAHEPQAALRGGLPHVAQFALPWPWIALEARAIAPAAADACRDVRADQARDPFLHRAEAGGIDDHIGGQVLAILEQFGEDLWFRVR